jgi:hypothetical protein
MVGMEVCYRVIPLAPVHVDHHTIEGADPRHGTTMAEVPAWSLIMPNTCLNRGSHDHGNPCLPRSSTMTRPAGRPDSTRTHRRRDTEAGPLQGRMALPSACQNAKASRRGGAHRLGGAYRGGHVMRRRRHGSRGRARRAWRGAPGKHRPCCWWLRLARLVQEADQRPALCDGMATDHRQPEVLSALGMSPRGQVEQRVGEFVLAAWISNGATTPDRDSDEQCQTHA